MEVEVRNRTQDPSVRSAGYTLPELLVTLAVAAVLIAWGAPDLIQLYRDNALTTETNRLISHLSRTRAESIKRNQPMVICRSSDGINCSRSSEARADWSMGWITYVNTDDDKVRDPGEALVQVGQALPAGLSLYFNKWWRLSFRPTGRASNGSFVLCNQYVNARVITVYRSGRVRVSTPTPEEQSNLCPSP